MPVDQSLQVTAIPAFDDNYLWLIHDQEYAAIVDPGDAASVEAALAAHQLKLAAILLTHHHADHAGGVPALLRHWNVPVYGPASERIPGISHPLRQGDVVTLTSPELRLSVLDVPGHTAGHIAYVAESEPWLFCGDTLFAGGCGRLFEGTAEQMTNSLEKISALPDNTKVYCAHEYTVSNLRFAVAAEPDNPRTAERLAAAQALRARGIATVPSTLGEEKLTNPFLRYREKSIVDLLKSSGRLDNENPVKAFAALREWKNVFR
ncbi:GloB Zn-dependent hydrolases, including glyoxylases [Oxalobacteraceae bacterium]